jgi:hypothetical protein
MNKTIDHLKDFKPHASAWFAKATFVREYFTFFQSFFRRENLEKAEWPDIQQIGQHMHCFQSMALAKGKALGNPNHPIEHYRKSFLFLAHGPGQPAGRIRQFCNDPEYRLDYFGKAAISELVGYLFPDQFMFVNTRDQFAAEFLGVPVEKAPGGDLVAELEAFNKATRPVANLYEEIVGRQTDLPVNFEVDQFFSWLYETQELEADGPDAGIVSKLKARLEKGVPWSKVVEEFAATFGKLEPTQVAHLANEQVWKLWNASKFAQTGTPGLPNLKSPEQWEGVRKMTRLLCDRSQTLGERFDAARAVFQDTFTPDQLQLPVLLRTLLILEGGRFGTVATKSHLNPLLKWAGKPEMDYAKPATITTALQNVGELIEAWAPKAGAESLGDRASIPWHLCKIIEAGLALPAADSELEETYVPAANGSGYWWLNANPKIWDFRTAPIGSVQTYTSHNEKGNKRRIYEHFQSIKPGDLLLGYVTNPDKEIVAMCEVTKGLHTNAEGEVIEFRKVEQFHKPVTWAELQGLPALSKCEPLINNQGSLFALTQTEFDTIRARIDSAQISEIPVPAPAPFSEANALADLFMTQEQLGVLLSRLQRKKALILQGPPGVGKTFVAKRLAYLLMKQKDDGRVATVQFHPSYGYEDFIQGFRPARNGGLERRNGVFYEFARLARNDPSRDWVFIIDEINRGNLAKIFGELLMLLEADKRGPNHQVSLTYSDKDESFYLPENLFVIGTMNTADRSLAMVDYALRRRFAFATLKPALDTEAFATCLTDRQAANQLVGRIRTNIAKLNAHIDKERDLGERFRIGHSYFCPGPNVTPNDAWYQDVILSEIQPLLEEYFDSTETVESLVQDLLQ